MATIEKQRRETVPPGEVAVTWVDADVHPLPHPSDGFLDYAPKDWRDKLAPKGHEIPGVSARIYDQPEARWSPTGRGDSISPKGGPSCSDPEFAARQLFYEAGMDIGIHLPMVGAHRNPDYEHALKVTCNNWLTDVWLERNNTHGRWRGSISVCGREPELAAQEIERMAGHPMMVQVMMSPHAPTPPFGDPSYDPLYAAATRHGLPVCTHIIGNVPANTLQPVGSGGNFSDYIPSWGLVYVSHVMSLVFDGAFDRHPELRVLVAEGGFLWALPLMWRMDAVWEARRAELPHVKRRPSEYIREHMYFTTQPLDDVDTKEEIQLTNWLDMSDHLLFATDYPHFTFDDPKWALRRLPAEKHDRIIRENAMRLYDLPRTVPALPAVDD